MKANKTTREKNDLHSSIDSFNEHELVSSASSDANAFRVLYRHYFPRVFVYVAYRVGSKHDTEDLVSEVFVRVVERIDRFEYRGEGSFAAWLFRITHNLLNDYYRRGKRMQSIPLDDVPEIESLSPTPERIVQQKERFLVLRGAIQALSARRQEIVTLRFFGGLRNQEIAEVLGLDERTVASHLARALQDLEGRLSAQHREEINEF